MSTISVTPPPPIGATIMEGRQFTRVWSGWFRNLYNVLVPGISTSISAPGSMTFQNGILVAQAASTGISITITTAPLTAGGTSGSMTFQNGILMSQVAAT